MEVLKVEEWLKICNDYNCGYGSTYDCDYGCRDGSGNGCGDGSNYGYEWGNGYGFGFGSGYGSCFGSGSGSGSSSGSSSGYGNGCGSGDGIKEFNGLKVYVVDDIQTIITNIKGNLAKGFILLSDLTLNPCFVVKGQGYFAHGETVKEAREALQSKIFENMDTDETINKFIGTFEKGKEYTAKDFYEWHHYLTGSCEMGRKSFMQDHGISFEDKMTVDEFINLCRDSYGGDIIKQLEERYKDEE